MSSPSCDKTAGGGVSILEVRWSSAVSELVVLCRKGGPWLSPVLRMVDDLKTHASERYNSPSILAQFRMT